MIPLLLMVPIAGCGSGDGAPSAGGGPRPRPKIRGELSPSEAKEKLRQMEKKAPRGRAGVSGLSPEALLAGDGTTSLHGTAAVG